MINLLPPTVKEQVRYARMNRVALKYLRLIIVVLVVLAGIFGSSIFLLNQQADSLAGDVADKQQQIAKLGPATKKAQEAADRLNAIKYIQSTQTRFSLLLDDLAKVLPRGVSMDSITLTGDDKKPVRISVTGNTYDSILAFREAMAQSPRISGVDLESISQAPGGYQANVVIGFKPGQAK